MKHLLVLLSFLTITTKILGQLDTIHWLPPIHARIDWGPQFLYLSTPEKDTFTVTIRDGSGNFIRSVTLSNTQPYTYDIGSTDNTYALVTADDLHKPLKNKGLIIDGKKNFYAYFRTHASSRNHAGDLTCKGRPALGKTFRIGHLLQEVEPTNSRRANFIGILATEDSTRIDLTGYQTGTTFRQGGTNVAGGGGQTVSLNKGESVVFSSYVEATAAASSPNGLMGALLEANHPVVVTCGSFTGAPVSVSAHDIGIDQIVPIEHIGDEYIICKGNGSSVLERPIIVAHYNNTQVRLNGSTTPIITLSAGEYYAVPTSSYSNDDNMYIRTSQPIYLYQMIGGAPSGQNEFRTAGLIFVPPISCAIPNAIDNIISPNVIGSMSFDGGVMITAMRDSIVEVRIDGRLVNLGAPGTVQGHPDFVTYRNLQLFSQSTPVSNISIVAHGAIQVAMYGQNNAASYAAFYSGFSKTKKPRLELVNIGDGVCPDTLVAKGFFDGIQWTYEDTILKYGKDTFLIIAAPGRYIAEGYLGVCRRSETAADTLDINFKSPAFAYSATQPSCFGYTNGKIIFGTPYGGFPPYQFSIDNGRTFTKNNTFGSVSAGNHKLVARDSLGCYNRPLAIKIGQPPQLTVEIVPLISLPEFLNEGQLVKLQGIPNRKIISATWSPTDATGCVNCIKEYTFYPIESTHFMLLVKDSAGCSAIDTFSVLIQPNVYAPNVIAPNSESNNKAFTIFSKEKLPIRHLAVFDRWGEHIFDTRNIETNNVHQGWDGTFRGKHVPQEVYVYYAEVEVLPGRFVIVKGDITVLY